MVWKTTQVINCFSTVTRAECGKTVHKFVRKKREIARPASYLTRSSVLSSKRLCLSTLKPIFQKTRHTKILRAGAESAMPMKITPLTNIINSFLWQNYPYYAYSFPLGSSFFASCACAAMPVQVNNPAMIKIFFIVIIFFVLTLQRYKHKIKETFQKNYNMVKE